MDPGLCRVLLAGILVGRDGKGSDLITWSASDTLYCSYVFELDT